MERSFVSHREAITNAAHTPSAALCVRVALVVLVALRAMSIVQFVASDKAPAKVLTARNRLEVLRINTAGDPTFVIEIESFRDRSDQKLIRHAMRNFQNSPDPKCTVSLSVCGTHPKPTSGLRDRQDILKELGRERYGLRHASILQELRV